MHPHITKTSSLLIAGLLAGALTLSACSGENGATPPPCTECGTQSGQLRVPDRSARACEVLVEATDGRVASVDFEAGVVGKAIVEGDRAGIALIATGAAPLPEVAGTVHFDGALKHVESTCFGETGEAIAGSGVDL